MGLFGADGGLASCASAARKGGFLARSCSRLEIVHPARRCVGLGYFATQRSQVRVLPSLRRGSSVAEHWGGSSESVTSSDLVLALTMHQEAEMPKFAKSKKAPN